MTDRARGIFISQYQKSWEPQPWQVFVDVRATVGLKVDPLWPVFKQIARDHDVILGAVMYQLSWLPWKDQLDFFLDVAQDADYFNNDYEGYGGNVKSKQFALDAVNLHHAGQAATPKQFGTYSSKKFVQEWMYPYLVYDARDFTNFWNAQWPFKYWDERIATMHVVEEGWFPVLPAGFKMENCKKWQYGAEWLGRGPFEGVSSDHVCLEMFMGTLAELRRWAKLDYEEPEIPSGNDYTLGWNDALDEVRVSLDGLTRTEG